MPSLEEMRELEKKATSGPWRNPYKEEEPYNNQITGPQETPVIYADYYDGPVLAVNRENAALLMATRNLFPLLLDFLEAWDKFKHAEDCAVIASYADPDCVDAMRDVEIARKAIDEVKI